MRLLYLDCSAGIAGDMLLAALLDLGAPLDYVLEGLRALRLSEPWEMELLETARRGVRAKQLIVRVGGRPLDVEERQPGDDDLLEHHHHHSRCLHHHDHPHDDHSHHAHDDPGYDHGHQRHGHGDHFHPEVPSRPYREIRRLLDSAPLPGRVRERAQRAFWELARAEAGVHGIDPDSVHFHEVGSTDAIIDVVGAALAIESLRIDAIEASPLHLGSGFVTMAHGRMPVPAPATLRLIEGLPAYQTDVRGELVTPTGAALVRALCRRVGPMPQMRIVQSGWGAGAKDFPIPNVLRAILGETGASAPGHLCAPASPHAREAHDEAPPLEALPEETAGLLRDDVVEIETNLDDMSPELLGALVERLIEVGALDAWVVPATMKKGRPGHILHALSPPERWGAVSDMILRESTALGLRYRRLSRLVLEREWITVTTSAGAVRVKVARRAQEVWNIAPEYEDCARAARRSGLALKKVMAEAYKQALAHLEAHHAS